MFRSFRAALGRFCARRAAAAQRDAPRRALAWLRLGCKFAPSFADTYPALVHLSRALDDRWGAVEAAREATVRFPDHADAWMLLGEALQMVFRQDEALGAFEQALALEERADAAMAAGTLYHRTAQFPEAPARVALDDKAHVQQGEHPQRQRPGFQHAPRQLGATWLQHDRHGVERRKHVDAEVDERDLAHAADPEHRGEARPRGGLRHRAPQ